MDASFIPIAVTPSKTPTGLDQLRRSYKTSLTAQAAIAAAPALYAADEEFSNMFLMEVSTPESAESATRIDLVYMGSLLGDGAALVPLQVELSKTPTGLDQLKRTYKTTLAAEDAIAAAPVAGTADTVYANMFLTRIDVPQSPENPTRIDLVYMGSIEGDGSALVLIEVVPSSSPFALDQLRRTYKTTLSAEDALVAAPALGTADAVYPNMFLVQVNIPQSPETPTRVDLLYSGTMSGTLPAQKHDEGTAVQSASSSASSDGRRASPALTVQFYAPTSQLSYFSAGAPGTDIVADPTGTLQSITLTVGDQAISIGSGTIDDLIAAFFTVQILETHQSTEIVPGQFWQNISKKIKSYTPFIFNVSPGPVVSLNSPGTGYTIGDLLTIAGGGGTAGITVVSVGISDSITSFTVTSNTITSAVTGLGAAGGSGTGASFNVIIIT